jgi:hypothetical protein
VQCPSRPGSRARLGSGWGHSPIDEKHEVNFFLDNTKSDQSCYNLADRSGKYHDVLINRQEMVQVFEIQKYLSDYVKNQKKNRI